MSDGLSLIKAGVATDDAWEDTFGRRHLDISFVLPCLNEEGTLGDCLKEIHRTLARRTEIQYEIVVADNGSVDKSSEIAISHGARIVKVAIKGYGSALNAGIKAAQGKYVIFADSDGTYHLSDSYMMKRCLARLIW